ncbi:MAG: hypothetical protein PHY80_02030 [Rickettsiales bacterium]|nr:hypothetical protein [Rickettsiales bacterium]
MKKFIQELIFEDKEIFKNETTIDGNREKLIVQKTNTELEKFNYKYSNDNLYYRGEIALWKAVILQGLIDLQSNSKKKIANTYRIKALMWFNLKNEEFLQVCNWAGLDPTYVYQKAKKVKKSNKFFN